MGWLVLVEVGRSCVSISGGSSLNSPVFDVNSRVELEYPLHVLILLLAAVLCGVLVDWTLLMLGLRKVVGWVKVGLGKLIPLFGLFCWRCAAV